MCGLTRHAFVVFSRHNKPRFESCAHSILHSWRYRKSLSQIQCILQIWLPEQCRELRGLSNSWALLHSTLWARLNNVGADVYWHFAEHEQWKVPARFSTNYACTNFLNTVPWILTPWTIDLISGFYKFPFSLHLVRKLNHIMKDIQFIILAHRSVSLVRSARLSSFDFETFKSTNSFTILSTKYKNERWQEEY